MTKSIFATSWRWAGRCVLGAMLFAVFTVSLDSVAQSQTGKSVHPRERQTLPATHLPSTSVHMMLEMAGVRATDFLIDLGSGDGRLVITAAKVHGARGLGIDMDRDSVAIANENARKERVDEKIKFVEQDPSRVDLGSATVISLSRTGDWILALRPKLFSMKAGTRIISLDGRLGDWEPEAKAKVAPPELRPGLGQEKWIYLWIVPAKVGGTWWSQVPGSHGWIDVKLDFTQDFQKIDGKLNLRDRSLPIERPNLSGNFVSFRVQEGGETLLFTGLVQNGRITGQVTRAGGRVLRWRANRENSQ